MHPWIIAIASAILAVASVEPAAADNCLSPADLRETLALNRVVAPVVAIRAARQAVPNSDVVRARLCPRDDALVYVIVTLKPDGKAVWVTVDGASGKVSALR